MEQTSQPTLFDNTDSDNGEPTKLTNGWYETLKYGPVFVNHGKAWAVQIIGNRLANVVVELSKDDVIGRSAVEKMKDNIAYKTRQQLRRGK
jgi:hypothetical protein